MVIYKELFLDTEGIRDLFTEGAAWCEISQFYGIVTLGARDFSCAVSGFGQALISNPREKPLDRSAISLMAPNQSEVRLNQFSPDFGRES